MKKLFLLFLLTVVLQWTVAWAQPEQQPVTLSPGKTFEKVFDRFGNSYALNDIRIRTQVIAPNQNGNETRTESTITPATLLCTAGYFDLYFELGSGFEQSTPTEIARRNVLCQLFTDLSNFITPVNPSTKVNIWVRDINNIIPGAYSTGVLGVASSFYVPPSISPSSSGIIDGEIWKTINTGFDSYTNVTSPLISQSSQPTSTGSGVFYHGLLGFNFNNWSINWHTDLTNPTSSGLYDLYTVALHEATHALGFASLIDYNGDSKFGTAFNYYSRYDLYLQDQSGQPLVTTSSACSLYDYGFNPSLTASTLLSPNPATCGSTIPYSGSLDNTTCSTAVVFAGAVNQAVYTPDCFEPPSSLSHLEDQCCSPSPHPNNEYYCMSNATGSGVTFMKRYLKPEERGVLCDIGYKVGTYYGNTMYTANNYSYGGSACTGLDVAGVNDGITTGGTFTFFVATSGTVNINGIDLLGNDYNADEFECLEVMNGLGTVSLTNGNSSATVTFTAGSSTGIALLRYIPVNTTTGNRGNITYSYVYVYNGSCIPTACNMVMNGGFESGSNCGQQNYCCPADNPIIDCWDRIDWSADYFVRGCIPASYPDFTIPTGPGVCNPSSDTWDNGSGGNDAFLGMGFYHYGSYYLIESEQSMLSTPIMPNTSYTLSFWARSTNGGGNWEGNNTVMFRGDVGPVVGIQYNTPFAYGDYLTDVFVPNDGEWHFYSQQFTYTGTQPLYNLLVANTGYGNFNWHSYAFIDDIVLTPSNIVAKFQPPSGDLCTKISKIDNLADYVFPTPPPGASFSGPGVSFSGGIYSFTAPSDGLFTIFYTYTNNLGCVITIPAQINASINPPPVISMYSTIALGKLFTYDSRIGNGIEGYYGGSGHIMAGVKYNAPASGITVPSPLVIKEHFNGIGGGPLSFNRAYQFIDPISGNPLEVNESRIVEIKDGTGFVCVSSFKVRRTTVPWLNSFVCGVLYMELDKFGNVMFTQKYTVAPIVGGVPLAVTDLTVTAVKQLTATSPAVDEFVITGQIKEGEETQIFVLPVDRMGNMMWGGGMLYDMPGVPPSTQEMPTDIIENPFGMVGPFTRLHIVGHVEILGSGSSRDAFVLTVDETAGGTMNFQVYDFSGKFDAFTNIIPLDYRNKPGFAVSGYSHTNAFNIGEMLAMKFDVNMVPEWSYTYDDADVPGNVHEAYAITDIMDCKTGEYRLAIAGSRNGFGIRDAIEVLLDSDGTPLRGMDISDLGGDEYAVSVDYIPTGRIVLFNHHANVFPVENHYLLFGCFSAHHKVLQNPAPFTISYPAINFTPPFVQETSWLTGVTDFTETLLCLAQPSIGNNNNKGTEIETFNYPAFKAMPDIGGSTANTGISVSPNPVSKTLTIQVDNITNATVLIRSVQGVLVGKAQHMGSNQYNFDTTPLASGMYFVEVVNENTCKTVKFIKQ